jgi:uncharacterized membrane protein YphA (DoxX/SURF4 family)
MKNDLFYAIVCVVLAVVFIYSLNVKMDRIQKNREYIEKFGIEAYVYKTIVRTVIFFAILMIFAELLYMK